MEEIKEEFVPGYSPEQEKKMKELCEANKNKLLIWRDTINDGLLPFTEYQPSYKERPKK